MTEVKKKIKFFTLALVILAALFQFKPTEFLFIAPLKAEIATTTVRVTYCGNAQVEEGEVCDDGVNNGQYATSTTGRNCMPGCTAWGPYCGDAILQPIYNEECDDGNNTSNDGCSSDCKSEVIPPSGGGGAGPFIPGGFAPTGETKLIVNGFAYPNASVNILKDGRTVAVVPSDARGEFRFETTDISPGVANFSFWAEDKNQLKSVAFTLTFRVIQGAVTTVTGAYLPPTIGLEKRVVKKGESLGVFGQTISKADVFAHFRSPQEFIEKTKSQEDGSWRIQFDTSSLKEEDFHTAKALFQAKIDGNIIKSSFSQAVSFYVGEKIRDKIGSPDLNKDGRVNLVDFSILLFHWGSSDPTADINFDGKVNLADFSILLYHWTG